MDPIMYKRIVAIAIIFVLVWAGAILFRAGREKAVRSVDFWRSRWKIVLFWIVLIGMLAVLYYFGDQLGLISWLDKIIKK